jgi:Cys-rich protein (TIGR01571 family)
MTTHWDQGACECYKDMGICVHAYCCPCFAFKEIADNIGDTNGVLYCLATCPCCCGCCVLTALGKSVADMQGIESNIVSSGCRSCFDVFCCYSCTVLNESRVIKAKKEGGIAAEKMER